MSAVHAMVGRQGSDFVVSPGADAARAREDAHTAKRTIARRDRARRTRVNYRRRFRTIAAMQAIISRASPVVPAGTPTPSDVEQ